MFQGFGGRSQSLVVSAIPTGDMVENELGGEFEMWPVQEEEERPVAMRMCGDICESAI